MRLRLTEILDYYDTPQLFVAKDVVGTMYLCVLYDEDEEGRNLCLGTNISAHRLNDLITGHLDLRHIYLEPEMNLYNVVMDGNELNASIREDAPTEEMLPDEGYCLNYKQRENHDMVATAQELNRTIIRLCFNYETNDHAVSSDVLIDTIHHFQTLLSGAFRKVTKSKNADMARLSARAALAASFDLELEAAEPINLFGGSRVADTLELISPLFGNDDEAVANCLATFKSTLGSYRNLMKTLSKGNISFKCKWVQGFAGTEVEECPVTKERVQSLYSLASNLEMLEEKEVSFEGTFYMANVKKGRWSLEPSLEGKVVSGTCSEAGTLNGIILQDQLYRIVCTERPSRNPNTGKEYKTYILTDYKKID